MATRVYPVILRHGESGKFIAECPNIVGCLTQGDTIDEALANIARRSNFVWKTCAMPDCCGTREFEPCKGDPTITVSIRSPLQGSGVWPILTQGCANTLRPGLC